MFFVDLRYVGNHFIDESKVNSVVPVDLDHAVGHRSQVCAKQLEQLLGLGDPDRLEEQVLFFSLRLLLKHPLDQDEEPHLQPAQLHLKVDFLEHYQLLVKKVSFVA